MAIHLHILLDNLFRQKTLLPDWCISIRYFAIKGLPIEQLHHSAVFLRWVLLSTASQHESTETQGYIHDVSAAKKSRVKSFPYFVFALQVDESLKRRAVCYDILKHKVLKTFQQTREPVVFHNRFTNQVYVIHWKITS